MRAFFFVAIMFIIILHGNSVYALKENNYVEFVVEGKIIPLKKETKQRVVSTLESLLPTCASDSVTNAETWNMFADPTEGWNRLIQENHIHILYEEPINIIRNGETIKISKMLLSVSDFFGVYHLMKEQLYSTTVEVYTWDKKNMRGFGQCDISMLELFCNTEIKEHLSGKGLLERCNKLERQTVNGIQN